MRRNQLVGVVILAVLLVIGVVWRLTRTDEPEPELLPETGSAQHGIATSGPATKRASGPRAPAVPASIAGRVTRKSDGAGVEGAIVALGRAEFDTMFGEKDSDALTTTTDAQGAWKIEKVPPARYSVAATAKALVPASVEKLVLAEGEHRTGVDLVLESGGSRVSGTVSDVGGGPVPGARITIEKDTDSPFGTAQLMTLAGPDGTYEMTLADGEYQAEATHEDYTRARRGFEITGSPITIDFTLAPGGTIRGVVVTREGKPLAGAMVLASGGRGRGGGGGTTQSDDKGEFVLRSLGSGAISLTAAGRGFASEAPTIVELGIGEQIDGVRVIVDPAFTISGNVYETGTKKGIPGVRLGVFSIANASFAIAPDPTDVDGAFEIVGVKPASYMMFALGETTMPEIGKPVEVVDKDVTGVVLEMGVGVTVSGRVEPGAVATITIEPTQMGIGNIFEAIKSLLVRAESDATGAFTLKHVPSGTFTLRAKVRDGRAGSVPLIVEKQDKSDVVVKLEPRASIAGKVLDANGAPVPFVLVEVSDKSEEGSQGNFRMSPNDDRGTRTAADGAFKVVGLEDGVMSISVSDSQGPIPWASAANKDKAKEPIEITLAKAEQKTGVRLTVEARDGVIRGVVVGPDKKPVADAWVTAHVEASVTGMVGYELGDDMRGEGKPPTLTGADGAFTFEKLRHADYRIVAETAKGTSRGELKNVKLGSRVTVVLASLGTLRGKVTLDGAPSPSFTISCSGPGNFDMPRQFTSKEGTYELDRIPPGSLKCAASSDAGRGEAEVEVPAGPATLDIKLSPWATITGTVVSVLDGKPIEGLKIIASGGDFSGTALTDTLTGKGPTSDVNGRFTITKVGAGKGSIAVMPKEAGFVELAHREYEVTAGQRLDLGTIKVVPPRTGDAGTLGLSTNLEGEVLTIATVKPGGPAEAAGVLVGDKLAAINGVPVATLTPKLAQTLLSSGSVTIGQRYQLTLDRAGTPVEVVLVGVRW
ncbi:MAG: carboxypeptidase regulatory-like domain-containing protein [Deltaproteobacteria bacterium]|nr:carboxypeptidase regulatory-like domain-containing protein [Deltaproteobacteria bacterium]